jgi:ABC-type glycerol-3-phosphate transport system substrate-binding protein
VDFMSDTQFGKRLSRRTLLGGIAGTAAAAILVACGGSKATEAPTTAATTASGAATAAGTKPAATTGAAGTSAPAVATTASGTSASTTGSATTAASGSVAAGGATPATGLTAGQSVVAQKFASTAGAGSDIDKIDIKGKTIAIDFWHTQQKQNEDALKKVVADFMAANPGITVNPQYVGNYTELAQKLQVGIQAKTLPAVSVGYESNVADYMQGDALLDFSPYINSKTYGWTKDDLSDFFPGFLDRNIFPQFKNQVLSVPFTTSALMLWYNLDLVKAAGFSAPPKTWDEFKTQAAAIVKNGKKGYPVAVDASTIDGIVFSYGSDVISDDGKKAKFDTPAAVSSLKVLEDMVKAGTAYQIKPGSFEDQDAFAAGDAAFILRSSTTRAFVGSTIQNDPKDPTKGDKFQWSGAIIPQGPENLKTPATTIFGANAIIFKSTPEKQLASWLFLKYFTAKDVTSYWSTASGYLPVRRSAADSEFTKKFFAEKPVNRAAFDVAPYGKGEPKQLGWQKARDYIQDAQTQILNKQITADDAAKQIQKKINDELANA